MTPRIVIAAMLLTKNVAEGCQQSTQAVMITIMLPSCKDFDDDT